jgi:hypothetical protein
MTTANGSGSKVPWRDVVLYVVLAYGAAWALWFVLVPHIGHLFTAARTPEKLSVSSLATLGMFAPLVAALVMRLFVSKEGLRGSLGPIRKWRYYGLAVLVPMVLISLTIALDVAIGVGNFTWRGSVPLWVEYVAEAFNALTFSALLAFGEEYGWRGYLLPKLLPLGEVRAGVLIGLIWGPWHIPLLIDGLNYSGVNPRLAIVAFIGAAVLMSLLFTRMFVLAGGSVLVTSVMHGSFNAFGDTLNATKYLSGNPLVVSSAGLVGLAVLTIAVLIAYSRLFRTAKRRHSDHVAGPRPISQAQPIGVTARRVA